MWNLKRCSLQLSSSKIRFLHVHSINFNPCGFGFEIVGNGARTIVLDGAGKLVDLTAQIQQPLFFLIQIDATILYLHLHFHFSLIYFFFILLFIISLFSRAIQFFKEPFHFNNFQPNKIRFLFIFIYISYKFHMPKEQQNNKVMTEILKIKIVLDWATQFSIFKTTDSSHF